MSKIISEREKHERRRRRAYIAPDSPSSPLSSSAGSSTTLREQGRWANLPPELLVDIIQRVEARETCWPRRRDVVACAAVCRSWRKITKEIVKTPEQRGVLTFPISLKQPGPRDTPIECFIKREKATSTYRLYMGLSPGNFNKLLLVAKKVRRATCCDFLISLVGNDFSRSSINYVGKLRSNFMGNKFNIFDGQPAKDSPGQSGCRSRRIIRLRQVSPRKPMSITAKISYELNVLRTRGPRRMKCSMYSIPVSAIEQGGSAPTPMAFTKCHDEDCSPLLDSERKRAFETLRSVPLVLRNKAPRWHEQLQCWCLNFKGRVTVASVKNFQMVATVEPSQNVTAPEQEKVILQFGKIGRDIFTMDYRYPLSALQAFAISLSSFDTKPVCE
ncbi:tubby like protein 6 [Hibiscus trionum]|uniref:Tubby like protein 6 n=1 Tax=Hibiscus trionum TaxID=183268 RepID=A0A9W7HS59_HIBTR|nr:tubby like protein 6 [Hibiscus trionum]